MLALWENNIPGFQPEHGQPIPTITPFVVESTRAHGAVVVVPGGGYGMKADHEGAPISLWLNSLGLSAFVLDYRVAPYQHPYPLLDAQRAIRYIRYHAEQWNIDPNKIGIIGFSAGGHLTSTAATLFDMGDPQATDAVDRISNRPDFAVLCYPVISFGEYRHHGSMVNLIGENPDPQLRTVLSTENSVTDRTPPCFLWHTADDGAVPVENSLLFAEALRKHQVPFALHVFPSGCHGLGLAQDVPYVREWTSLCAEWLRATNMV